MSYDKNAECEESQILVHNRKRRNGRPPPKQIPTKEPLTTSSSSSSLTHVSALRRMSLRFIILLMVIFLMDVIFLGCYQQLWSHLSWTRAFRKGDASSTTTTTTIPMIWNTTATSGNVYNMKKIRTLDESLLWFQSYSNQELQPKSKWPKGDFWNRPHCQNWAATTTMFPPTATLEQFFAMDGWCLVVVVVDGAKSQEKLPRHDHMVVLSRKRQDELAKRLALVRTTTSWGNDDNIDIVVARKKNMAYLYAIANGAQFIWDFDDKNVFFPNETLSSYTSHSNDKKTTTTTVVTVDARNNVECGVFNPFPFFQSTEQGAWPRGFPLNKIHAPECDLSGQYCISEVPRELIGIYQSLADKDPDVDAVFGLTRRLPITFSGAVKDLPVLVPPHTMAPMNAQATLFSQMGMWSMFLPTTVQGRVSDIWRSYIAQAVGKYCGMLVAFVGPHVVRYGNAHASYLADMNTEKHLYERSGSLVSYLLNEWKYEDSTTTVEGALERLYVDLYERGIVERQDVELVQLWISSLQSVGYKFPAIGKRPSGKGSVPSVKQRNAKETSKTCKSWKNFFYFEDVVLVGQFNYDTPAKTVLDWVKRWRTVFRHVDARGPFSNDTLAFLNSLGVNAFWGGDDMGFFSPMKNLADSLLLYANSSRGVILAHDDLLFNVSRLMKLGIPRYDFIIGQYHPKALVTPYMTVYGNNTYQLYDQTTLHNCNHTKPLGTWWWWDFFMPILSEAVAHSFNDGRGVDFYERGQSDFLYVPTRLAKEFSTHADWMVRHKVFLELGMPTIVGRLKENDSHLKYKTATLCTNWTRDVRANASQWWHHCFAPEKQLLAKDPAMLLPYGTFHPLKVNVVGSQHWNTMFDCIVLGDVQSCPVADS